MFDMRINMQLCDISVTLNIYSCIFYIFSGTLGSVLNDIQKLQLQAQLGNIFRPGAPIEKYALFAGRTQQTERVIGAVLQPGQHAILYGERGVGKTSLARVFSEVLSGAGITTARSGTVNCDPTDDYSSLWHKAFREITFKTKFPAPYF